jgi:hypothetical protein
MLVFVWVVALTSTLIHAHDSRLDGVKALVRRHIPEHVDSFSFQLVNRTDEGFVLSDTGDGGQKGIKVECSSISACSRGLYA